MVDGNGPTVKRRTVMHEAERTVHRKMTTGFWLLKCSETPSISSSMDVYTFTCGSALLQIIHLKITKKKKKKGSSLSSYFNVTSGYDTTVSKNTAEK